MIDYLATLEREGKRSGLKWVCRESTTGRGMRLHQTLGDHECLDGLMLFDTPAEAIADYCRRNAVRPVMVVEPEPEEPRL